MSRNRSECVQQQVTLDAVPCDARDHLPRMYGAVNYVPVDDICKLPLKVADIYRKLTT